ncbi:MAG: sigma 54-interacting transcriptional regulator [Myxococcales bacterium]|nr:sigma 54-interacting transcriptional regulator [Myxococcales bacterium]
MIPPASTSSVALQSLEVLSGTRRGVKLTLGTAAGSGVSIGRAPQNQLMLADDHLSSEHGQIFREGDRVLFRDFKSTNGSRVLRKSGPLVPVDASCGFEVELHEGDQLLLGDPQNPVAVLFRSESTAMLSSAGPSPGDSGETEVGRVLARRALAEAEAVAGKVERDPQVAALLLATTKKLGRRGLDLQAVFEGLADAAFELVPLATHIAVELGDGPDGRMATVFAVARRGEPKPDAKTDAKTDAKSDGKGEAKAAPLRASRAVVRRVLQERAAVLIANAAQDLAGVASIMGARIQSILGVPLWEGDDIRGVIQVDNRANSAMFKERDLEVLLVLAGLGTLAIENARLHQRLRMAEEQARGEARFLKHSEEKRRAPAPIGQSPAMREVLRQVEKVQATRATVCIEGETGTGKELIASLIHYQSPRRDKLFVAQNCAAVPETLLESELFGHKKGAFTGADSDKKGLFEVADGGTLFLDEIGETSLGLQAKLLRVLQESEIRPVGATQPRKVDVRIVCATNRSLEKEVAEGRFRQDLYYRLKVFPLRLPPLRERRDDVPLLAEYFLKKYAQELKKPISGFTPDTLSQLASYNWPGNVRELENEVQRLCIQVEPDHFITPDLLAPHMRQAEGVVDRIAPKKGPLKDMLEEVERFLILQCLKEHDGNKTRAAEALGITREGLHKKLARFGL